MGGKALGIRSYRGWNKQVAVIANGVAHIIDQGWSVGSSRIQDLIRLAFSQITFWRNSDANDPVSPLKFWHRDLQIFRPDA